MSEFESPLLEATATQLQEFGYTLVHRQQGHDPQGRFINVKVFHCERNQLQVTLQTAKVASVVDVEREKIVTEENTTDENG